MGHPIKSAITDDIEPKRRYISIVTIVFMALILAYVAQYFWKNSDHLRNIETFLSEFAPKQETECERHYHVIEKLVWYDNNIGEINTSSILFFSSRKPIEKQVRKTTIAFFYHEVVESTLRRFLLKLKAHFEKDIEKRLLQEASPLEQFVRATNDISELKQAYYNAKKDLEDFDKIYQKVFAEELAINKIPLTKLQKDLERVRAICIKLEFPPSLSSLDKVEHQAFEGLRNAVQEKFHNFLVVKSAANPSFILSQCGRLHKSLSQVSRQHTEVAQRYSLQELNKKLLPAIEDLEREFSFSKQANYKKFYQKILQQDLQRCKESLGRLKDEQLRDILLKEYLQQQATISKKSLAQLQSVRLSAAHEDLEFSDLYPNIHFLASQARILLQLNANQENPSPDFVKIAMKLLDKVIELRKISTGSGRRDISQIKYGEAFQIEWAEAIEAFTGDFLEKIFLDFQNQISQANQKYLDSRSSRRSYLRRISQAVRKLTGDVKIFHDMAKDLVDETYWEELEKDITDLKDAQDRDISDSITIFIKNIQNLTKEKRLDLKRKIQNNELLRVDKSEIFYFVPRIYNNKTFSMSELLKESKESPIVSFIKLDLQYKITQELHPANLKKIFYEFWQYSCQKFLDVESHHIKNWNEKFLEKYMVGKKFTTRLKNYDDRVNLSQLETYYTGLTDFITIQISKVFSLKEIENFLDVRDLESFAKEKIEPKIKQFHGHLIKIDQDIIELFRVNASEEVDEDRKTANANKSLKKIIKIFSSYIKPWLELKYKLREQGENALIIEEVSELNNWVGEDVLKTLRTYNNFSESVRKIPRKRFDGYLDPDKILREWNRYLKKDFDKWHKQTIESLYNIFEDTQRNIRSKFPFQRKVKRECSPREVKQFFGKFIKIQKKYKEYLIEDKNYGEQCRKDFKKFEEWQKFFENNTPEFNVEELKVEVEIKKFPVPSRTTGIHDMQFAKVDLRDMIRRKRNFFEWQLEDEISVRLKILHRIRGQRDRVEIASVKRPLLESKWKLFRLIDDHLAKTNESYIYLSFPYSHNVNSQKVTKQAQVVLEIKDFHLPWLTKN